MHSADWVPMFFSHDVPEQITLEKLGKFYYHHVTVIPPGLLDLGRANTRADDKSQRAGWPAMIYTTVH